MVSGGMACVKYLLFLFNLIFAVRILIFIPFIRFYIIQNYLIYIFIHTFSCCLQRFIYVWNIYKIISLFLSCCLLCLEILSYRYILFCCAMGVFFVRGRSIINIHIPCSMLRNRCKQKERKKYVLCTIQRWLFIFTVSCPFLFCFPFRIEYFCNEAK